MSFGSTSQYPPKSASRQGNNTGSNRGSQSDESSVIGSGPAKIYVPKNQNKSETSQESGPK